MPDIEPTIDEQSVLDAARALTAAFGAHDTITYFSMFADDASLSFHNVSRIMTSRAEYEAEWATWEADGFQVLSCRSHGGRAQVIGDVAVYTHRVTTQLKDGDGVAESFERETIVFNRADGDRWLVVHEHLSIDSFATS